MGSCVAVPMPTRPTPEMSKPQTDPVPVVNVSKEPPADPLLPLEEAYAQRDFMAPWTFAAVIKQNQDYQEYYGKPYKKNDI